MWKHAPGLLVVEGLGPDFELSGASKRELWPLDEYSYVRYGALEEIQAVKGLEFQHVFVFIDKVLFDEINKGFSGTGRPVYNKRRLMRIPFSRARDSMGTFAM